MAHLNEYKVQKSEIEAALTYFKSNPSKFSKKEFCEQVGGTMSAVSSAINHYYDKTYEQLIFERIPGALPRRPRYQNKYVFLESLCKSIAELLDSDDSIKTFSLSKRNIDSKLSTEESGSLGRKARQCYPDFKEFKTAVYTWFKDNRPDLLEILE